MPVSALVGLQWGDEGKGKVIDALSGTVDMVVRCQGGANAGHTVIVGTQKRVLHLVPSGILYQHVTGVIGNGVVIDPLQLVSEIESLEAAGYVVRDRLLLSDRAHVVMPWHKELDAMAEEQRGDAKLGTTGRGIGPAYADKAARTGILLGDFVSEERGTQLFDAALAVKNRLLVAGGRPALERDRILPPLLAAAARLRPMVTDTADRLHAAVRDRRDIYLEGAQGTLLDIDHGTYPYVTSSNTHVAGLLLGCGIPPKQLSRVIGIAKAYCTRVGSGPFPTEDHGPTGELIRARGREFGATTGRPRRCGWFDAVAVRHTIAANGVDEITLTKADVLSGLDEVKVCVAYRAGGVEMTRFPTSSELARLEPAYRVFPGWKEDLADIRLYEELPLTLRRYIEFLESFLETPITAVSTGPERGQLIRRMRA